MPGRNPYKQEKAVVGGVAEPVVADDAKKRSRKKRSGFPENWGKMTELEKDYWNYENHLEAFKGALKSLDRGIKRSEELQQKKADEDKHPRLGPETAADRAAGYDGWREVELASGEGETLAHRLYGNYVQVQPEAFLNQYTDAAEKADRRVMRLYITATEQAKGLFKATLSYAIAEKIENFSDIEAKAGDQSADGLRRELAQQVRDTVLRLIPLDIPIAQVEFVMGTIYSFCMDDGVGLEHLLEDSWQESLDGKNMFMEDFIDKLKYMVTDPDIKRKLDLPGSDLDVIRKSRQTEA